MARCLLRRSVSGAATLFGITLVSFFIIQLVPGDPAQLQTASIADTAVSARTPTPWRRCW